MNGTEILRIVDAIHRDKGIDKDIVFEGIEQAILSAARKHFDEESDVQVLVDRDSGEPSLSCDGEPLDGDLLGDLLGRISAQTAKQVMIQKIREAERDSLFDEYAELRSQIVTGTVTRVDRGTVIVNLGKVEAILPRGEQIPRENHRLNERVRAVVLDVRKAGSRVRVILSRTHADFVRRMFEVEIPEVSDRIIEVRSIAREAGHRSKVAVSCSDNKIDAVGACVGVRGARIRTIVDELNGERIDIVRWNDSLNILVPNAMQPSEVEDVILCPMLGKVIVLVHEDQLSLAIGRRGQNVRLASKLVGWDINVMTQEQLDEQLDISIAAFTQVPQITEDLAENLVSQGFFTFDDLSVIEPDQLAELSGLGTEDCDAIVEYADVESLKQERLEEEQKLRKAAEAAAAEAAGEVPGAVAAAAAEAASTEDEASVAEDDASAETVEASESSETVSDESESEAGESPGDEEESDVVLEAAAVDESAEQVVAQEDVEEHASPAETIEPAANESVEAASLTETQADAVEVAETVDTGDAERATDT